MLFSSPKITCTIDLDNPPLNDKYNCIDNNVYTTVNVKFTETETICMIKCGLLGVFESSTHVRRRRFDPVQNRTIVDTHRIFDRREFLNNFSMFSIDENFHDKSSKYSFDTFTIPQNQSFTKGFSFTIPNDKFLPSSCPKITNFGDEFSISYLIYIEIYTIGGLLPKKPKLSQTFTKPIYFQSSMDKILFQNSNSLQDVLNYPRIQIFDDKIKKFYYDEKSNALIPSSLTENHSKTRFIRSLWNDDYKKSNYKNITKSIPLEMNFSLNASFNIYAPLISQFNTILITDLKSIGIDSNQSKDFVYNGQSTHLGVFKIESFKISVSYKTVVKCQYRTLNFSNKKTIFETKFKDLEIDIRNFQYDKENENYKINFLPEQLINQTNGLLNKSIVNLTEYETILCTGSIEDWLKNLTSIECKWIITDGLSQERKYKFQTSATPDILY
ncbi:hypothetical protein C6P40_001327 [Pichia californica]|uniref:Uncharacterized protein n=1 Tax=Pichia californica TaxID=460514 RepID=A0A9P6WJL6_9ASCO|nr:hypothetical protein C6P42_001443 [[Candida] californica]KAG0688151.1 hypothetical protein C6P40_001327 [[Candida] californica]